MKPETRATLEVDDVIVLLLGAPAVSEALRDRLQGITRLEKLVFLLENETPFGKLMTEDAGFVSHHFGPFSAKIYQAVETLAAAELLEDSARRAPSTDESWEAEELIGTGSIDPYATRDFHLTDRGRRYYQAVLRELPTDTEATLRDFKARFASLPLRQLIRYVYMKYPEQTGKSKIRDKVLGK